ncbi:MAG TPA: protein kinase [Kofleriaceae bacterium]|nr:protein kinase [Kofleriaceae bacterium]
MAGTTLADKYRLVSLLGSGGMGVVYKAEQIGLGRSVAVKLLRRDLIATRFEWFRAEAMAASRINHPHAVAIYDFGITATGIPFLVMEHLRGRTLSSLIEESGVPMDRIVTIGAQVLSALAEAHACGVVHCDLTADNVLVDRLREGDDFAKVIDFGLARLFDQATRESHLVGTAEYMAPEQIRGDLIQPATDLYAVGILLYEMVVGRTPFAGASVPVILDGHLNAVPAAPHQIVPHCPAALGQLILDALDKVPERRPATAGEMRTRLLASLGERYRPAAAFPVGSMQVSPRTLVGMSPNPTISAPSHGPTISMPALSPPPLQARGVMANGTGKQELLARQSGPPPRRSDRLTCELTAPARLTPSPFMGRSAELDAALAFVRAQPGGGGALAVVGPTGVGKARLALELGRRLGQVSLRSFVAAADPSGLRSSWYPMLHLLEGVLGLEPPFDLNLLRRAVARAGLPDRDVPGLAEVFGLSNPAEGLELAVRRREAHASVVRVLVAAQRRFTRVLYCFVDWDDYDQPSRDAVRGLIEATADAPSVRVLVTAREVPDFATRVIQLSGLDSGPARELITALVGGEHPVPDPATVTSLTSGSPAALEQLAGWIARGDSPAGVPALLVDLVSVRINRLDVAARRVLQAVSVHGSVAQRWVVEASLSPEELVTLSDRGWQTGLLVVEPATLTIPSDLVASVVWACTPADVRRRLHRRALDSLSTLATPGVLAHHAEQSGEIKRAYRHYMTAGADAVRRFDDRGAARWYARGAAMARELESRGVPGAPAELVDALLHLAEVMRLAGDWRAAGGALDEAEGQTRTDRQRALAERTRGMLALAVGDAAAAVAALETAAGAALRAGDRDTLCQIYLDLAQALERAGRPAEATTELVQAIDVLTLGEGLARATGPERLWRVGLALAERYATAGRWAEARQTAGQALSFARQGGWPHARGRLFALLADFSDQAGDRAAAMRYRASAIEEMQVLGDRRTTAELLIATARTAQQRQQESGTTAGAPPSSDAEWAADPNETIRMAGRLAAEVGWREGVELSRSAPPRGKE